MEKIVRVYFSTFIDVPVESEDFSNDEEMVEYVKENISDSIEPQDLYDNLAIDPIDVDVLTANDFEY